MPVAAQLKAAKLASPALTMSVVLRFGVLRTALLACSAASLLLNGITDKTHTAKLASDV